MLDKLKGAWTRAKVNHPRKLFAGGVASTNGAAACLIPLDGGLTFTIIACCSFIGGGATAMIDGMENGFGEAHKRSGSIIYKGKTYLGTRAQKNAYNNLDRKIYELKEQFGVARTKRKKNSLLKKAQSCVRKQEYILEDMIEEGKPHPTDDMEFKLERRHVRGKASKVGAN